MSRVGMIVRVHKSNSVLSLSFLFCYLLLFSFSFLPTLSPFHLFSLTPFCFFIGHFCLLFWYISLSLHSHLISPVKVMFLLLPPLLQDLHLKLLHKLLLLLIKPYLLLQLKITTSCQKLCLSVYVCVCVCVRACVQTPDNHADSSKERRRHLAGSCCDMTWHRLSR